MLRDIFEMTKSHEYNFISPRGLGDTMVLCGILYILEQKYGYKIHLIIKRSHEPILKMYENVNYSIYEFSQDELFGISWNNYTPKLGKLFVAHPIYSDCTGIIMHKFNSGEITFLQMSLLFFHLDEKTIIKKPIKYPSISKDMFMFLDGNDINNVALILPEANSVRMLNKESWTDIVREIRRRGLFVVQNCCDAQFAIEDVPVLPDNLYFIIAIAVTCAEVYSIRSGLCDIIAGKSKHLTVFYADKSLYRQYYLEGSNIENIVVINRKLLNKRKQIILRISKYIIRKLIRIMMPSFIRNKIRNKINTIYDEMDHRINRKYAECFNEILDMRQNIYKE